MKPLRVLLIHRDRDSYRYLTGWWSYPVPEFTWQAVKVPQVGFHVPVDPRAFDLAVMDDWIFGTVEARGVPLVYVIVDSARSDKQLQRNLLQATLADLLLIDSDELWKFKSAGKPVRRFAYAVNERLFFPREKIYDVAFLCWPTPPRRLVCEQARQICERHGWSFLTGTYSAQDYAAAIASAKIVIHKPHVEKGRSWRVFDVMASRGCLLSSPLLQVDGDGFQCGTHYAEYHDETSLEMELERLLTNNAWEGLAEAGYQHVLKQHTWSVRATELCETLGRELAVWA